MADKLKDYNNGFQRGLEVAYEKTVEGGKDAIIEEIRYRGRCKKNNPIKQKRHRENSNGNKRECDTDDTCNVDAGTA